MSRNAERVVVTGMGVASPLGCSLTQFWTSLLAGRSGVRSLEGTIFFDLTSKIGGIVQDYDESQYFDSKESRRMSRSSQLGLIAARQAILDAGLENGDTSLDRTEVGILIGSSIGGYSASDPSFKSFHTRGRISPLTSPISRNVGPAANVSIKYGNS